MLINCYQYLQYNYGQSIDTICEFVEIEFRILVGIDCQLFQYELTGNTVYRLR